MWPRLHALTVSVVLSGLVLWPLQTHLPQGPVVRDSFPLSTYPMFSKARPKLEPATYLVAFEDDGTRHFVPYTHWATGGWNQGRAQVHRYKRGKAGGPEALCARVAESLARSTRSWEARVTRVAMVKGRYDPERWFVEEYQLPVTETVHAECPVERQP